MMKYWRLLILTVYAAITFAAMVRMGQPASAEWYLTSIPFLLWALAPVAVLCLLSAHPKALGIGALISAAFGIWMYADSAWGNTADAQSGLAFVFIPVAQFVFAGIWIAATFALARTSTKDI